MPASFFWTNGKLAAEPRRVHDATGSVLFVRDLNRQDQEQENYTLHRITSFPFEPRKLAIFQRTVVLIALKP